ncbi:hypothetical protein Q7P37_005588 [Cladosporium fusiforme]
MFTWYRLIVVAIVGVILAAWQNLPSSTPSGPRNYVKGKNNTVLFVVNEHPGLSNVHAATAQSLLQFHPDVEVHFASFPRLGKSLNRISEFAKRHEPQSKDIIFHPLAGLSYTETFPTHHPHIDMDEDGKIGGISEPGIEGIKRLGKDMQIFLDPWNQEEHLSLYQQILALIDEVDPAMIALDTIFSPAIEATRARNRLHAFITPNMLVDNFPGEQPWLGMLWKYPAMGSGFPFPIPWKLVLQNMYLNFHLISSLIKMPDISAKRRFLEDNGVPSPINFYGLHRPDVPWITQTTHALTIPMDFVPQNVTCTGPITLSAASAQDQDAELTQWISQKPTILINLGSAFTYSRTQTRIMVEAISQILHDTDIQILWKYKFDANIEFDWKTLMIPLEQTGRVKVTKWLSIDPFSLLASGHISAFVTHGGANGFHESIAAGVPQIVLPMWADLYNYAQLAESGGIGVWGCRESSPEWTSQCLRDSIVKVASSADSVGFQDRARAISAEAKAQGTGRDIAAAIIADYVRK